MAVRHRLLVAISVTKFEDLTGYTPSKGMSKGVFIAECTMCGALGTYQNEEDANTNADTHAYESHGISNTYRDNVDKVPSDVKALRNNMSEMRHDLHTEREITDNLRKLIKALELRISVLESLSAENRNPKGKSNHGD